MSCSHCGRAEADWEWLFFHVAKSAERVCNCRVNLEGATIYPHGMCPSLDRHVEQIEQVLRETAAACPK